MDDVKELRPCYQPLVIITQGCNLQLTYLCLSHIPFCNAVSCKQSMNVDRRSTSSSLKCDMISLLDTARLNSFSSGSNSLSKMSMRTAPTLCVSILIVIYPLCVINVKVRNMCTTQSLSLCGGVRDIQQRIVHVSVGVITNTTPSKFSHQDSPTISYPLLSSQRTASMRFSDGQS